MEPAVKRRAYSSPRRAQAARQTKAAILAASRPLFISQGYAGTTVAAIAEDAGVAVDTVYASVGRKPQVFRLLLESALSGTDEEVPALERDYVKQIEATSDAVVKLAVYAEAVTSIQGDWHHCSWWSGRPQPPNRSSPRCGPASRSAG